MTTITFACPQCQTNLKTSQRIAADQDIRCPKCGTVFPAPPETNLDSSSDSSMEKSVAALENTWDRSDHHGADYADKALVGSALVTTGANRVKRILLGSALIVALFTAGTAYLAWRTIENWGRNEGTGDEDPLAFVPAGSTLVVGVDLGALADHPDWADQLEKGIRGLHRAPSFWDDCKTNSGIEFRELFDQVILAFKLDGLNPNEPPHVTLIARSKLPFNQNRIRDAEKDMYREVAEGKTYYKRNDGDMMDLTWLFMPSDRILILSSLPQYEIETLMEKDGTKPLVSPDEVRWIREVQANPFWAVLPFSESVRKNLSLTSAFLRQTQLAPVLKILSQAKGARASARWDEDNMAVTLNVECKDESAARQGSIQVQEILAKLRKERKGMLLFLKVFLPFSEPSLELIGNALKEAGLSSEAADLRMTTLVPAPTPEKLTPLAQQISGMLGFGRSRLVDPANPRPLLRIGPRAPGGPPQQPPPGKV